MLARRGAAAGGGWRGGRAQPGPRRDGLRGYAKLGPAPPRATPTSRHPNLGRLRGRRATPTWVGSATPTWVGSATPTWVGSATPTWVGSATPTWVGSATPTWVGSATPTWVGSAGSAPQPGSAPWVGSPTWVGFAPHPNPGRVARSPRSRPRRPNPGRVAPPTWVGSAPAPQPRSGRSGTPTWVGFAPHPNPGRVAPAPQPRSGRPGRSGRPTPTPVGSPPSTENRHRRCRGRAGSSDSSV